MKAWLKRNWKKILGVIAGILLVILVIVFIKYLLSPAERDLSTNRNNDRSNSNDARSSNGGGFKQYGEIMEYPDPLKISRMNCPVNIPKNPNLLLITGYQWQFQSNQTITIGYRASGGRIVEVKWYPGKSGYNEFPIGTTELYVYGGSEGATLTVMVYRKNS